MPNCQPACQTNKKKKVALLPCEEKQKRKKKKMAAVLLVVGMQNDKYGARAAYTCNTSLARVNDCILAARQREWQVVFALDLHHPQHMSFQTQPAHCVLRSWGSDIVNGLQYGFDGSDMVVRGLDKDDDSDDAFFVSNLFAESPSQLRKLLASRRLCLCGFSPDGCIEQTAITASTRGYCQGDPVVISDCSSLLTPCLSPYLSLKTLDELMAMW